ncbi:MAG: hypothetical protein HGB10_09035 [Coriobacteriia bacterium]|nr:hypothetical protein [Coriobacteriia bacterium]
MNRTGTLLGRLVAATLLLVCLPTLALGATLTLPVASVSFSDTDNGFLSAGFYGSGLEYGVLSRTTDGGATWHAQRFGSPAWMGGVSASADGNSAIAGVRNNHGGIYATSDSGLAWVLESLFPLASANFYDVAYLSGGRRVAVGIAGESPGIIASSVGGGAWTQSFRGPVYAAPAGSEDPPPTVKAFFTAVDSAPGGDVAWAVGSEWVTPFGSADPLGAPTALIRKTVDGGSTWTTQTVGSAGAAITSVVAVDTQTAFIGREQGRLYRTLDGGATWNDLTTSNSVFGFTRKINGVDAVDANHVVIVGDGGKLAYSSNATSPTITWTATNPMAGTKELLGVQMIDADSWIVVGDDETIMRTDDAGATWRGQKAAAAPTVKITSPEQATMLNSTSISAEGTSTDGYGIGVRSIELKLQRESDSKYWNGADWTSSETWVGAEQSNPANGWNAWEKTISIPDTGSVGAWVKLSARATDGFGSSSTTSVASLPFTTITADRSTITVNYGAGTTIAGVLKSGATVQSGKLVSIKGGTTSKSTTTDGSGRFSFPVSKTSNRTTYTISYTGSPVLMPSSAVVVVMPKVKLNRPVVPSTIRHTKSFRTYADMWPKHSSGSTGMTFYFDRRYKVGGKYVYITKATSTIKSSSYKTWTRCATTRKLAAGTWRVRVKHSDSYHATTYSSYRYFTVR